MTGAHPDAIRVSAQNLRTRLESARAIGGGTRETVALDVLADAVILIEGIAGIIADMRNTEGGRE